MDIANDPELQDILTNNPKISKQDDLWAYQATHELANGDDILRLLRACPIPFYRLTSAQTHTDEECITRARPRAPSTLLGASSPLLC